MPLAPKPLTAVAGPDEPMLPRPYRVTRRRRETLDTVTLELVSADAGHATSFAPGQFNMLYVFGVGEVPISISGDPHDPSTVRHTTRMVGAVTNAVGKLKAGEWLGVRGPFGSRWPLEDVQGCDVVIVAGGIGLAPLRPCLYGLLANRRQYRKIVLLYGTRTPQDILYKRELEQWRGRFDIDVELTVDRASESWRGEVGVVPMLIPKAPVDPSHTVAMVCGPEVMMHYTIKALMERGVASDRIFLSMERNMHCAIGFCGHCQLGPTFICKDGPVFRYDRIARLVRIREL